MDSHKAAIKSFPSEWTVLQIRDAFDLQQGKQVSKAHRKGDRQRPFLRTANVFWGGLDLQVLDHMHFSEAEEKRLALKSGDLLVCEGGSIGRTALWRSELDGCYYQNHLHRLRARSSAVVPEFVLYWFWYAFAFSGAYRGQGNATTIPNLSQSRLGQLFMPMPPTREQQQIARILGTVQRALECQQRIIDNTRELKRGVMGKLFTEGLRGERQKATAMGLAPESWCEKRIGEIAMLKSGGTPSRNNPAYWINGTIPWVKTGEVNYCLITDTEEKITRAALAGSSARVFPAGTLLMAMYGQGITRGKVAVLGTDAATNQACLAFFPTNEVRSGFLYQLFSHKYEYLRHFGHGANQKNLSADILRSLRIVYPADVSEQDEIVSMLNSLDETLAVEIRQHTVLSDLFNTLLHELMTAAVRVNGIDFDALGVPSLA